MKISVETCVAGATIDRTYRQAMMRPKSGQRAGRCNPTPEAVHEVNRRNAEKSLTRILNHNFAPGDWHLVLTYQGATPSQEKAKADRERFLRKMRTMAEKAGVNLKWIAVTEYQHTRIHHHIVCTHLPFELISQAWEHGQVRPSVMDKSRNYRKLAAYLIKETSKTYREEGSAFHRRYTCSRNIERPVVRKTVIEARDIPDPKALKGYYIDQETVRWFEHAITGLEQLEFIMVAMEERPRLKRWYKGTVVTKQENYNRMLTEEKQVRFDLFEGGV